MDEELKFPTTIEDVAIYKELKFKNFRQSYHKLKFDIFNAIRFYTYNNGYQPKVILLSGHAKHILMTFSENIFCNDDTIKQFEVFDIPAYSIYEFKPSDLEFLIL